MLKQLAAATLMMCALVTKADATVLLDIKNSGITHGGEALLPFVAQGPQTTIAISGYEVGGEEEVIDSMVFAQGSSDNLLPPVFTFTPAPKGSEASQSPGGIDGTDEFVFLGYVKGSYDTFSAPFATVAGQTYIYSFLYRDFNDDPAGPTSGLRITVTPTGPTVPEPAAWLLTLVATGMVGTMLRRRPAQDRQQRPAAA